MAVQEKRTFIEVGMPPLMPAETSQTEALHLPVCGLLEPGNASASSDSSKTALWMQAATRLPSPAPIPREVGQNVTRTRKRKGPGRHERALFNDISYRPFDMIAIDGGTEIRSSLLADGPVKQYLEVTSLLESYSPDTVSVVACQILDRGAAQGQDAVGIYFAVDLTVRDDAPRMILVDFVVLPAYRTPEVYAEIGRWVFIQLLSNTSSDLKGNPFNKREASYTYCVITPLTTDLNEQESQTRVMAAFGFQPVSQEEKAKRITPLLDRACDWAARLPLAPHYFGDAKSSRTFVSMGPFSREAGQHKASQLFSKMGWENTKGKIEASAMASSGCPVREPLKESLQRGQDGALRVETIGRARALHWDRTDHPLRMRAILKFPSSVSARWVSIGVPMPLPDDHAILATCCISTTIRVDGIERREFIITDPPLKGLEMKRDSNSAAECQLSVSFKVIPSRRLNNWMEVLPAHAVTLYCKVQVACFLRTPRAESSPFHLASCDVGDEHGYLEWTLMP